MHTGERLAATKKEVISISRLSNELKTTSHTSHIGTSQRTYFAVSSPIIIFQH